MGQNFVWRDLFREGVGLCYVSREGWGVDGWKRRTERKTQDQINKKKKQISPPEGKLQGSKKENIMLGMFRSLRLEKNSEGSENARAPF